MKAESTLFNTHLAVVPGILIKGKKMINPVQGPVCVRFTSEEDHETLSLEFNGTMIIVRFDGVEELIRDTRICNGISSTSGV